MTKSPPSRADELLVTALLLVVEVVLGTAALYAALLLVWALALGNTIPALICVLVICLAVAAVVGAVTLTARRGYRLAPVALVTVGPLLCAAVFFGLS